MDIKFDVEAIRQIKFDTVVPKLFVTGDRDHRERDRVYEKHESHYRTLVWLGWQFQGIHILDVGTRAGTSAVCLADNPANKVTTCDINHMRKGIDVRDFMVKAGIEYIESDAAQLPEDIIKRSSIIMLDISHNGEDEQRFFERLNQINYNGIVLMDDVSFPRHFPKLHEFWNSIPQEKLLLPRAISHDTGTGVVIYGQHTVSVILPPSQP